MNATQWWVAGHLIGEWVTTREGEEEVEHPPPRGTTVATDVPPPAKHSLLSVTSPVSNDRHMSNDHPPG